MGNLFGMKLHTSDHMPKDRIYMLSGVASRHDFWDDSYQKAKASGTLIARVDWSITFVAANNPETEDYYEVLD